MTIKRKENIEVIKIRSRDFKEEFIKNYFLKN